MKKNIRGNGAHIFDCVGLETKRKEIMAICWAQKINKQRKMVYRDLINQ